jgi:hypothetical protein
MVKKMMMVMMGALCLCGGAAARGFLDEKAHDADTALCDPVKQYTG